MVGRRGIMRDRVISNLFDKAFDMVNHILMILISVVMLYPMLYVAFASFSDPLLFVKHKGILWGSVGFTMNSYKMAFRNQLLLKSYGNTLFVLVVGVIINLLLTSIGAYFLTRKEVRLQKAVSIYIIITMFFNGGIIPFYFAVKDLGLENSLWSLIWPSAINTFNLLIMKVSFSTIPDSLEESARLDGAGHLTILFRIIIPVTKATVAVIGLYYAVAHWNSWFNAMLFLNKRETYPLQLILREILIQNDTMAMSIGSEVGQHEYVGETIKYAVIMIATLPILCVYPFIQKYFTKGVMIGALKG